MSKEKQKVSGTIETEVKKEKANLQYKFSNIELLDLGKQLAEGQEQLKQLDNDRKQSADEWKARISGKEAEITSLSSRVSRGYEYRDIACELTLNNPPGKKTLVRLDTGETVWIRDLTEDEKQRSLDLKVDEEQRD